MNINIVGPPLWRSLHAITFAYPETATTEQSQSAVAFFDALVPLFPCDKCRPHLAAELQRHPVKDVAGGRDAFARWLVDLHNRVNARLGKPQWTFEAAAAEYSALGCGGDCSAENPKSNSTASKIQSQSSQKSQSQSQSKWGGWLWLIALVAFLLGACVAAAVGFGLVAWQNKTGLHSSSLSLSSANLDSFALPEGGL
jgi:hypothetical protein